jgi:hypothetical protein
VFADDDASAASVGEDFVADAGRLEWEDGDATNRQIRVRIIDDDLPEDSERITVLLTDPEGGVGLGKAGQIVDILPNDGAEDDPGQLGFTSNGYRVDEENEDGGVIVRVSRTDGSTGAVGVNYSTTDGTATAGTDFTARSGTLNWADGDSDVKSIYISTRSDSRYEGNETFQIQLSDATGGAALGSLSTATVTIIDNDGGRASDNGGVRNSV